MQTHPENSIGTKGYGVLQGRPFIVDGLSAQEVKNRLQKRGVEVAANQAAFTPLDMQARQLDAVVRASAHTCTAQAEIEQFLDAVAQL